MTVQQCDPSRWSRPRASCVFSALAAAVLFLGLVAVALAPPVKQGTEKFGAIVDQIKGHPGATAVISLSAGAALWLTVGLLVAGQEYRAARRKMP
jgi:hypothetical protein